jgi:hypothetical protein
VVSPSNTQGAAPETAICADPDVPAPATTMPIAPLVSDVEGITTACFPSCSLHLRRRSPILYNGIGITCQPLFSSSAEIIADLKMRVGAYAPLSLGALRVPGGRARASSFIPAAIFKSRPMDVRAGMSP